MSTLTPEDEANLYAALREQPPLMQTLTLEESELAVAALRSEAKILIEEASRAFNLDAHDYASVLFDSSVKMNILADRLTWGGFDSGV
jgi:hypothetical protein